MSNNREEVTMLIECYLDGTLTPEERIQLEQRMRVDDWFRKEFELHLQVRRTFTWALEQREMRRKMDHFHLAFEETPEAPRQTERRSRSGWRIAVLAATVSLVVCVSTLAGYNFINSGQKPLSGYATLNRIEPAIPQTPVEKHDPAPVTEIVSQNIATAFALSSEGYMLTNYHVVKDKKYVYVEQFSDSLRKFVAEVVDVDRRLDIAILRITDPQFETFGAIPYTLASEEALIGQRVYTLGYPKSEIVYNEGSISSITGFHSDTISLQLGIPVNPGNSGAPVFTEQGELVAVITGKNRVADGEAFGVKAAYLRDFLLSREEETDAEERSIILPRRNFLKGKKITEQVKALQPFIFIIRA